MSDSEFRSFLGAYAMRLKGLGVGRASRFGHRGAQVFGDSVWRIWVWDRTAEDTSLRPYRLKHVRLQAGL